MKKYLSALAVLFLLFSCKKDETKPTVPPQENRVPQLVTNGISGLSHFSVLLGGKITDSGSAAVSETGIVVDSFSSPTTSRNLNKFELKANSNGSFSITATYLPSHTRLYVRSYAVNKYGTGYGNEVVFSSLEDKIFQGDVTLTTQQQVIDFGAGHYTTINGGLTISGPVTDLTPLSGLTVINYAFEISNTLLTGFNGLDSLEISGAIFSSIVRIENNPNLINCKGLDKLAESYGYFYLLNNASLASLDGLENYQANYFGEFRIQNCPALQNVNGLKNLLYVGGPFCIMDNATLNDITGFSKLSVIAEKLLISNNPSLQNLNGLEKIKSLPNGIELTNNTALSDLQGIGNLDSIGGGPHGMGNIIIDGNISLTSISAFSKIKTADYITIQNNKLLKDLQGLNNIQSVTNFLHVENNETLVDLSGLEKIASADRVEVFSNGSMITLKGLEGLKKLGNDYSLNVRSNNSLQSLTGLENLQHANGIVSIAYNPVLTEFCSLKQLISLGYQNNLDIEKNLANPSRDEILTNCP